MKTHITFIQLLSSPQWPKNESNPDKVNNLTFRNNHYNLPIITDQYYNTRQIQAVIFRHVQYFR